MWWLVPYLIVVLVLVFSFRVFSKGEVAGVINWIAVWFLGIIYIALPLAHAVPLRQVSEGRWWILFLLVVIWANDSFAYYGGRAFGSTKLSPVVSPNKTVEGSVSGLIGGAVAAVVYGNFFLQGTEVVELLVISLLVGVVAIIGDLSESLIKRSYGVKDSGTLLPGHGGLLDRIDSLIFAVPVLFYYLTW